MLRKKIKILKMKSNILTLVLLCLFTVNEIKAQKIGFGSCATVPINSGFNASLV